MNSLLEDLGKSLRQSEFWAYSTWLDIVTRYRRLHLGMVWALVPPLVYIFGLGYMYSGISASRQNYHFVLHLGLGWALWRMTTSVINDASGIYVSHKAFILDGRTCLTDYLLRAMAKALFHFFFAFAVVLVVMLWESSVHWQNMLTLLVTIPVYLFNLLWLAVVVSLLGTRFPDIREFISTMLMFGFFLTPILWIAQALPPGSMRGTVARLNPAFHFVEMVRAPIMGFPVETASLIVVACMSVGGWLLAIWLYRRYARFVPLWM